MLKDELNELLDRILAWPAAAGEELLVAISKIENHHGLHYSQLYEGKASSLKETFDVDDEVEVFFKRLSFWFGNCMHQQF